MLHKVMLDWADVLETTDRGQCRAALVMGEHRCCIGILGDMLGMRMETPDEQELVYFKTQEVSGLPTARFYRMNDNKGMSFVEIAGEIRKMVEKDKERG